MVALKPCSITTPHPSHGWTAPWFSEITGRWKTGNYHCGGVHKHFLVLDRKGFGWREFACVPHPDRPEPDWACNYTLRVRTSALRRALHGHNTHPLWFMD